MDRLDKRCLSLKLIEKLHSNFIESSTGMSQPSTSLLLWPPTRQHIRTLLFLVTKETTVIPKNQKWGDVKKNECGKAVSKASPKRQLFQVHLLCPTAIGNPNRPALFHLWRAPGNQAQVCHCFRLSLRPVREMGG